MAQHGINMNNVNFVTNKEKRKTIGYIEGCDTYFTDFVLENAPKLREYVLADWDNLLMKSRYVASATCSPDDEWDEDFGRLVAYDRLKHALNNSFFKRAERLVNDVEKNLNNFVDVVNRYGSKLTINARRRQDIINQKVGE